MKLRNCGACERRVKVTREVDSAYLEECILLLRLELVGTKDLEATGNLLIGETAVVALKQLEDIVDDDGLKVNLFLIVQVLGAKLDLGHVDVGICIVGATSTKTSN